MIKLVITSLLSCVLAIGYSQSSEKVVRGFLTEVRSGRSPEKAEYYMADTVLAHQVTSENPVTVVRTPDQYAAHIIEFLRLYGDYEFEVTELISQKHKVYVRWKQTGKHLDTIDGYAPTQLPLTEYASAVYRIEKKKIVEYWIQIDRQGFDAQLKRNANGVEE